MIIRQRDGAAARAALYGLCDVLVDCVEGGASVGFMSPYGHADAARYWDTVFPAVDDGGTLLFTAEDETGRILGTVQVGIRQFPNQPHRADLKKLLVHSEARGQGIARRMMERAEAEALRHGRVLLVLDTATGSPAEEVYRRLGWSAAGVVPGYALFPDGRYCSTTFYYKQLGPLPAFGAKMV